MKTSARASLALAAALAMAGAEVATAAPLVITDAASLDRFAALVAAYQRTSRVRWRVEAGNPVVRQQVLTELADRLGPARADLLERVEAVAVSGTPAGGPPSAKAVITIAPPPASPCSWRVTLADPVAPAPEGETLAIPLERGDVAPASAGATFEVGFSGPLQSTLYAFAETGPGALRDLAAVDALAIPVAASADETLVLVRARRPVPFLDGLRAALSAHPGERRALGPDAALAARLGANRGIGANIQLLDPAMVVAGADLPPEPSKAPDGQALPPLVGSADDLVARADDLAETCLYTIARAPEVF